MSLHGLPAEQEPLGSQLSHKADWNQTSTWELLVVFTMLIYHETGDNGGLPRKSNSKHLSPCRTLCFHLDWDLIQLMATRTLVWHNFYVPLFSVITQARASSMNGTGDFYSVSFNAINCDDYVVAAHSGDPPRQTLLKKNAFSSSARSLSDRCFILEAVIGRTDKTKSNDRYLLSHTI